MTVDLASKYLTNFVINNHKKHEVSSILVHYRYTNQPDKGLCLSREEWCKLWEITDPPKTAPKDGWDIHFGKMLDSGQYDEVRHHGKCHGPVGNWTPFDIAKHREDPHPHIRYRPGRIQKSVKPGFLRRPIIVDKT